MLCLREPETSCVWLLLPDLSDLSTFIISSQSLFFFTKNDNFSIIQQGSEIPRSTRMCQINGIVMSVWVIPMVPRGKEIQDCSYPTKNDRMFNRNLQALRILGDSHIPNISSPAFCLEGDLTWLLSKVRMSPISSHWRMRMSRIRRSQLRPLS